MGKRERHAYHPEEEQRLHPKLRRGSLGVGPGAAGGQGGTAPEWRP